ncbi:hypothetical protein PIB30_068158, partial [Stylosanthes scabra]|nr:hypothetical protein [Stylosanthes scabra]
MTSRKGSGTVDTRNKGQAELVFLIRQSNTIRCHPIRACNSPPQLSTRSRIISPSSNTSHILHTIRLVRATLYSLRLSTSTTHRPPPPKQLHYYPPPQMPHYSPSHQHLQQDVAQTPPPAQPQAQRPQRPSKQVRPLTCGTGRHLQQHPR